MLRPTAVSVTPHDDYSLTVTFDNGETKRFDVTPYIHGEWYSHLHDKAYFRAARTDGFTVVWRKDRTYVRMNSMKKAFRKNFRKEPV